MENKTIVLVLTGFSLLIISILLELTYPSINFIFPFTISFLGAVVFGLGLNIKR